MITHILSFTRRHKVHLISWCFFIFYEVLVAGVLYGRFSSFWDYFLHYAINIGLFYLHATVVLPFALQKPKPSYWLIPFLVIAEIAAYTAIMYAAEFVATRYFGLQLTRPLVFDYAYCFRSAWRGIYFMGFATAFYFLNNFIKEKIRADHSEKQRLLDIIENQNLQNQLVRSQNAFLKAQINPHFLFNTLSFVYNNVRKTSSKAADAILSLSQMMRYALQSDDEFDESDVLEEIEHVENLIYLHQLRHEQQLQVRLSYGSNLAGVKIIPLVLITLVENIFKHGDLTQEDHVAQIHITYTDGILRITTENLKNSDRPAGHRIGLDNIQSRLYHAYQDRAAFSAGPDEKGYFCVNLKIAGPNSSYRPQHQEYLNAV